jgi:hypothetical protein
MPWLATEVIKDNAIKALESSVIRFDTALHKGEMVVVQFGYYIANPKAAQKLGITQKEATDFIILKEQRFPVK